MKKKTTNDALKLMYKRYYEGSPSRIADLEQTLADQEVARQIYELRERAGLTQRELASKVGTTASVICRLEDGNYEGHSLSMLRRIAFALNKRIQIRFVPRRKVG